MHFSSRLNFLISVLFSCLLLSCTQENRSNEKLNSILWIQTSVERQMISQQAYALAKIKLDQALADAKWTASVEQIQQANYSDLPPAIIVDVDETVLDNSAFEARLVENETTFDEEIWNQWAREAKALPVPGAIEFVNDACSNGIKVFYVTNRDHQVEDATTRNLVDLGFPIDGQVDQLLTKNERENWGSDKTSRRLFLAQNYRIVLLIGDDLNDFISGAKTDPEDRLRLASEYKDYWGEKWILLPNPMYGSWEGALYGFQYDLTNREKTERKYGWLQTYE